MTKQPTLPPIKNHGRKKVHRTPKPMDNQQIAGVLGYTETQLIKLISSLELKSKFESDMGMPIDLDTIRMANDLRKILTNSKGEGV